MHFLHALGVVFFGSLVTKTHWSGKKISADVRSEGRAGGKMVVVCFRGTLGSYGRKGVTLLCCLHLIPGIKFAFNLNTRWVGGGRVGAKPRASPPVVCLQERAFALLECTFVWDGEVFSS